MPTFLGRVEVLRLKQRLDETFQRVGTIDPGNLELRSDMARYLCILVAGYVEKTLQELTIQWCRTQASPSVVRHASTTLKRIQNVNSNRLKQTLNSFDANWRDRIEADFQEELTALDSLYGNRHQIAHGANVGLTVAQVTAYYEQVQRLVNFMVDEMDPVLAP